MYLEARQNFLVLDYTNHPATKGIGDLDSKMEKTIMSPVGRP